MNEGHLVVLDMEMLSLTMNNSHMLRPFFPCTFLLESAQTSQDLWLTQASGVSHKPALGARMRRNADSALTVEGFTSSRKLIFPGLHGLA